jgi:hypothetical protein
MYKKLFYGLIAVLLVVVLAVGGMIKFGKNKVTASQVKDPWIEVVSPSVWQLDPETNEPDNDLQTGDEVAKGDILQTTNAGRAIVHFPDSSMLRIEPNSVVTIEEFNFETGNSKMSAKMKVSAGRVWSKIFDLATPDSSWQVETSNAVATVRGTAFGTSVDLNGSWIIGSQHSVNVEAIDPDGKTLEGVIEVGEGKALTMTDVDIDQAKNNREYIKTLVKDTPDEFKNADWVKSNQSQDAYYDSILSDLEKKFTDKQELRKEIAKFWFDRFQDDLARQNQEGKSKVYKYIVEVAEEVKQVVNKPTNPKPQTPSGQTPTTPPATPPAGSQVTSVVVFGFSNTKNIQPGTVLLFKAYAKYSDGSQKEISSEATWQADSSIGSIVGAGQLKAPNYNQSPSVSGTISASWRNPANGALLTGRASVNITFYQSSPNDKP